VKLVGKSALEEMKFAGLLLVIERGVIIAMLSTWRISLSYPTTHLEKEFILLSLDALIGAMENSMMGHTGYNPAKSSMW
jgi:hypothetical protein